MKVKLTWKSEVHRIECSRTATVKSIIVVMDDPDHPEDESYEYVKGVDGKFYEINEGNLPCDIEVIKKENS